MKFRFSIKVKMAPHIFDPQASTIEKSLKKMSYPVGDFAVGKVFDFSIEAPSEECARSIAKEIAEKVLSNPVLETFVLEREE
jgi:phosphoribosylformylglycinamidine synthase